MQKARKERFFLPSGTVLSCGCPPHAEPGGQEFSIGDVSGLEAVMDDSRSEIFPEREMIRYREGTVRHARCGRIINRSLPADSSWVFSLEERR